MLLAFDQELTVPPHARLVRPALPRTVATGETLGGSGRLGVPTFGMHNAKTAVEACTLHNGGGLRDGQWGLVPMNEGLAIS